MGLLGAALREYRVKNEISGKDMARFMGIDAGYLSRIEHGKAEPGEKVEKAFESAKEKWEAGKVKRSSKKAFFLFDPKGVITEDLTDRPEPTLQVAVSRGLDNLRESVKMDLLAQTNGPAVSTTLGFQNAEQFNKDYQDRQARTAQNEKMVEALNEREKLKDSIRRAMDLSLESRKVLRDLLERLV